MLYLSIILFVLHNHMKPIVDIWIYFFFDKVELNEWFDKIFYII